MKNRYRFWNVAIICLAATLIVAGCMAPPAKQYGAQTSPSMGRTLAPDQAKIDPSGHFSTSGNADGSDGLNQKVVKVGLLLPLTGRNADLGKALQDAATVSLFDKYARLSIRSQTVRVELIPKDTGDTPDQAASAMAAALKDGAQFIIGPLFADATSSAAPVARDKNVNVLSFSNTRTQASPGTFMFGFSPAEQTERIVTYALTNGKSHIAVLAPNSQLGETVLQAARDAANKQGQKIIEAKYLMQGAGIDTALNSLIPAGKTPAFDAILIPEGGLTLDTLMRGLAARGVRPSNVKFLGTGLWDDAELLRRVNLDTAWFASSPPELTNAFEQRFRDTYHYMPPRIASLAYDAVALAVTLATSGRPFDAVTLSSPAGYQGPANGIFRLRADGTVQRGLAVMEVHGGNLSVISPSPVGF